MKTCPRCNELLGHYADRCFKCGFDFTGKSHNSAEERIKYEIARRSLAIIDEKDEAIARLRRQINDNYEYAVEIITDDDTGGTDFDAIMRTLNKYSRQGWRLVNTFTNELGENSHIDYSTNTRINSTMDQVVMIFERRTISHETYVERISQGIDPYQEENAIITKAQEAINEIKNQVHAEMMKNGTVIAGSNTKDMISSIVNSSDKPLTAQEISEYLGNKLSLMDVLNYLQSMVNEGTIIKEGNTYSKTSVGSSSGINLSKY